MITITNLAMSYGAKLLFADVNLNISKNNRYALVGANGAGKTSFMKVVAKQEEASLGEINLTKNTKIGWLKQDHFIYENTSIINTVIAGKEELWKALQEKNLILTKDEFSDEDGFRLGDLEEIIQNQDGYDAESVAAELLVGLGIDEKYHYQNLSTLSGGYKLRALLAQSLFNNPDFLMLDEPTNHLDMPAIFWLENYLKEKFEGVIIFISHDLAFLNNVATHILDIDYGEIRQYTGNYDSFFEQKKAIIEQKLSERASVEKKIAQMMLFIDKFRAGTRSRQAASKEKQVNKIEIPDLLKTSRVSPNFDFKIQRPSGKLVVSTSNIGKNFDEKKVLGKVSFEISRGEKIIIVGPNGVGKSTLLKIILAKLKPDTGSYEWGYETQISYFAQDHHDLLNENLTAFDWLSKQVEKELPITIRTVMGQMLFRQDEALKNILNLSGGEGARLLLAKIMLEKNNVMLLDEPTNHLDIESKEALKNALIKYNGTLIMVTHDRDFASSIGTRVIALAHSGMLDFKGKYIEYLEKYKKDYLSREWNKK
jgi:ATPase subunit of ABC transporter with duplicated ATPase domains